MMIDDLTIFDNLTRLCMIAPQSNMLQRLVSNLTVVNCIGKTVHLTMTDIRLNSFFLVWLKPQLFIMGSGVEGFKESREQIDKKGKQLESYRHQSIKMT